MDIDEFLDREVPLIEKEPLITKELIEKEFVEKELVEYKEILEKINSSIERNELAQAEKFYSKIWFKIKEEKFTWRQDLHDTLIEVNKKLKESLNKLHQEITAKINNIHNLIAKTRSSLKEGKVKSALTSYSEIVAIYNGIPYLFLTEKKTIYINEILPLHKELREKIGKTFFDSFNSKLSKINNLIHSTKTELQKNNIKEAVKFYTDCLNLYTTLPDGFFLQKIELSNKILELYKEISIILEISNLKSRLKLRPQEKVSEKVRPIEEISAKPIQHKRPTVPEIHTPTKKSEKLKLKKPSRIKQPKKPKSIKLKKPLIKKPEKLKPKKLKKRPIEKKEKLKFKKPYRIKKLKKLPIKKPPFKKPEKIHPVEKPKPLQAVKISTLKERLVKTKISRALFKLNKGDTKGANEDLLDALRLEPDNEETKRLLERIK